MIEQRARHFGAAAMLGEAEESPGAFAEALDQPGLDQQLEMARDARLRLAQDVGQVGNGQFGFGQQRQHAQARFLTRRLESGVEGIETELGVAAHWTCAGLSGPGQVPAVWAGSHHIRISLYV